MHLYLPVCSGVDSLSPDKSLLVIKTGHQNLEYLTLVGEHLLSQGNIIFTPRGGGQGGSCTCADQMSW